MSTEYPTLDEERAALLQRIAELDRMREELPLAEKLKEEHRILTKLQEYLASLGLFKRKERKRMEEQIRLKKEQILAMEVELENLQHSIEDEISDLNLARQAIETEMERRRE